MRKSKRKKSRKVKLLVMVCLVAFIGYKGYGFANGVYNGGQAAVSNSSHKIKTFLSNNKGKAKSGINTVKNTAKDKNPVGAVKEKVQEKTENIKEKATDVKDGVTSEVPVIGNESSAETQNTDAPAINTTDVSSDENSSME